MKAIAVLAALFMSTSIWAADSSMSDVEKIVARSDGKYDVTCKDGSTQVATMEQIQADVVCGEAQLPIANVTAIFAQPDGTYFVLCNDNTWENATASDIRQGKVCPNNSVGKEICATKDTYVNYQIKAPSNASVTCSYQNKSSGGRNNFGGTVRFDSNSGRWTCPPWSPGNPNWWIFITVNGKEFKTDEQTALANACK